MILNQEERERVIEIMLGQEKVISLLYDKKLNGDGQPATNNNNQELMNYYAQLGLPVQDDLLDEADLGSLQGQFIEQMMQGQDL